MDHKDLVRSQFDRQAEKFAAWPVSREEGYLHGFFAFCRLSADDTVLDVGCGPGAFSVFCAMRVAQVTGVDLSAANLAIATRDAADLNLQNLRLVLHDVEDLPFSDGLFSAAICKSALHHIENVEQVFSEMARCTRPGGRVCVQDIVAYPEPRANEFFERFEKLVDCSHNRALSQEEVLALYAGGGPPPRSLLVHVDLDLADYLAHAERPADADAKIRALLAEGHEDLEVSRHLMVKNGRPCFRRRVLLVVGKRGPTARF